MQCLTSDKTYVFLRKIPVLGTVLRVANAYAYEGDEVSLIRIAPFSMWWDRVFRQAWYVMLFASVIVLIARFTKHPICTWKWEPSDTILGAFPSILGFGIGVYALMFVMPNEFLSFLQKRFDDGKSSVGPQIVPVDMAFPLLVYSLIMAFAAIDKAFPENLYFRFISFWALFYGLAVTVELISFLFNSSQLMLSIKADEENARKLKKTRYLFRNRK